MERGQERGGRRDRWEAETGAMGTDHLSAAKRSRRGDKWPVPVASSASNEKETSETSPCLFEGGAA